MLPHPPRLQPGDAVFLDFDGTLVQIAKTPESVTPAPYLSHLLLRTRAFLRGALGIISGRRIVDIDRLMRWSVLAVAGVHGLEYRGADGLIRAAVPAESDRLNNARRELRRLVTQIPRVRVEDKGCSLALHYRDCPEAKAICYAVAAELVSACADLECIEGLCVVEIKNARANKGSAMRAFLAESIFKGRRPIMIGDDVTDEYAFAAAREHGGYGVIVGGRTGTQATYALSTVTDVHAWLDPATRRRGNSVCEVAK